MSDYCKKHECYHINEVMGCLDCLKAQLKKAEKVIEFYGNEVNWSEDGTSIFTDRDLENYTEVTYDFHGQPYEEILVAQIGGKKAREYFKDKELGK